MLTPKKILLFITPIDTPYLTQLKPLLAGNQAFFIEQTPGTYAEIELYLKTKGIKYVISTNVGVLNKVIGGRKHQSLNKWNGSLYERNGITYLFLNPFKQFFTVTYGSFVAKRFIGKITNPESWPRTPEFTYDVATPESIESWYSRFSSCLFIAEDIETKSFTSQLTKQFETLIRCVAYTGLWQAGTIHTIVLPIGESGQDQLLFWVCWMRKFNNLKIPKIFQNGLYDTGHMLAYGCPAQNYFFDTQSMFHSWYSELPKRLDFIGAFCVHSIFYWKDMADEGGLPKLYEYNARDGWATLVSFMYLVQNMPQWAIKNYLLKFPLWVPCCYCNLEGVLIDNEQRATLVAQYKATFENSRARLRTVLGAEFNPNSPQQVTKLINFYGSTDISDSTEESVTKFGLRHPINARFASQIKSVRESSKIISTYLKPEGYSTAQDSKTKKENPLLRYGRMFYTLNPDGTDTGRLSAKEGIFWTGSQVQNQPEEVKAMWLADPGWELVEWDNETSESYCTGYSSGDSNLLSTLLSGKDFHATNAERFFGIPYNEIVKTENGIKIVSNKAIRDLSKRTNHGATYDMMWFTLLGTMGEENVDKAKNLLRLPSFWTRRRVCEFLLESYAKAYPTIQTKWYSAIVTIVNTVHMLVSPLGWTRYCFGDPSKSKRQKDSLIAHVPQNMSVGIINEGMKRIFWELQVPNYKNFRLKAQIHDSILAQIRLGHRHLAYEGQKLLVRPTKVKSIVDQIERTMTIPVSMKIGPSWSNMKTIEIPK